MSEPDAEAMAPPPEPELWFHRLATHYVEAQVLYHLNRVGVLRALEEAGPLTPAEVAGRLGLEEGPVGVLLEYARGVDHLLSCEDGRYGFTGWGRRVLERFSRTAGGERHLNLFDVRVGSYGPVWSALDRLMTGEVRYGRELTREGERAAEAVYKVSARFAPGVRALVDDLGARTVVELGVPSGLVERLGAGRPGLALRGLDRDEAALEEARRRTEAAGVPGARWIRGDLFDVAGWAAQAEGPGPGVFVSVHFHEFLAAGEEAVKGWLAQVAQRFPGWWVVALEQPRLPDAERERIPEAHWLYNQSNVLIHHLIGNGRIPTDAAWRRLFADAGCPVERAARLGFLDYRAYTARLKPV